MRCWSLDTSSAYTVKKISIVVLKQKKNIPRHQDSQTNCPGCHRSPVAVSACLPTFTHDLRCVEVMGVAMLVVGHVEASSIP